MESQMRHTALDPSDPHVRERAVELILCSVSKTAR